MVPKGLVCVLRSRTFLCDIVQVLFEVDPLSPGLSKQKAEWFHLIVMTSYYLANRTGGGIMTLLSFCATRVSSPTARDEINISSN